MQDNSLDLVMLLDRRDQAREFDRRFKLAVVSANPGRYVRQMFPEWFPPEEVGADDDLADTSGTWKFESTPSPEEAERILAQMLAEPTGVLTGDEFGEWR